MAKKSGKGLGRGLDAIFATENVELVTDNDKVLEISLEEIKKNPYQPRTIFNEEKLDELKESIEKNGLLQPIVVKKAVKGYYIIAGERRFRAFELLGKETIPAIVKEITDEEMMVFSVLENLQREDLSALEESESYKNLMDKMELTQEELAKKLGKSRPYIANSLRLLKLPTEIKNKLLSGELSAAHARTLLALKTKKAMHKAGFVNIVGKPNAGKSTLLNQLMGEKLAIVTQKAQTTRHRIFGIYNEEDVQIVFSDTPGVLDPKYELQEKMMGFVKESLQDADVFLFIVDISDKSEPSEFLIEKLNKIPIPVLLLINKIDKSNQKEMEAAVEHWHNLLPKAEILPISALNAYNTEYILPKLKSLLPENPPYYDKDQFTDKSERFFVNETVREKILLNYEKEIPYSVEVVTELFKEKEGIIFIDSIIYVERETQKGILIGHKGEAIKKVGTEARLDLEKFFAKKIHLNLFVKVKKDWRKNEKDLKNFGYR